jgi:hypothetical protein
MAVRRVRGMATAILFRVSCFFPTFVLGWLVLVIQTQHASGTLYEVYSAVRSCIIGTNDRSASVGTNSFPFLIQDLSLFFLCVLRVINGKQCLSFDSLP